MVKQRQQHFKNILKVHCTIPIASVLVVAYRSSICKATTAMHMPCHVMRDHGFMIVHKKLQARTPT
jgi:hypothetical protein